MKSAAYWERGVDRRPEVGNIHCGGLDSYPGLNGCCQLEGKRLRKELGLKVIGDMRWERGPSVSQLTTTDHRRGGLAQKCCTSVQLKCKTRKMEDNLSQGWPGKGSRQRRGCRADNT